MLFIGVLCKTCCRDKTHQVKRGISIVVIATWISENKPEILVSKKIKEKIIVIIIIITINK